MPIADELAANFRAGGKDRDFVFYYFTKQLLPHFKVEETPTAFEGAIRFCYTNGEPDPNAAVCELFRHFYFDLPENAQRNLRTVAREIGFDIERERERKQLGKKLVNAFGDAVDKRLTEVERQHYEQLKAKDAKGLPPKKGLFRRMFGG